MDLRRRCIEPRFINRRKSMCTIVFMWHDFVGNCRFQCVVGKLIATNHKIANICKVQVALHIVGILSFFVAKQGAIVKMCIVLKVTGHHPVHCREFFKEKHASQDNLMPTQSFRSISIHRVLCS